MATKTIAEINAARVESWQAKAPDLSEADALILSQATVVDYLSSS